MGAYDLECRAQGELVRLRHSRCLSRLQVADLIHRQWDLGAVSAANYILRLETQLASTLRANGRNSNQIDPHQHRLADYLAFLGAGRQERREFYRIVHQLAPEFKELKSRVKPYA
ncbi:hypothetical protein HY493_03145 [Candidatus Woesearchaeota archaeon]|nr:hypothetical protein [Candidatus Woesearchaeota archaeon]